MKSDELLSPSELSALRLQAEQLQSSISPSHKLDSRKAGWLATSALGSGMDYAESRVYQQGDDPRTINWRLSARSTETYVKTYHMESRPSLCIVLDQRRSMIFGTRQRLKITQALRLVFLLAFAAEQHRLNLQVMLISDNLHWLGDQNIGELLPQLNHASITEAQSQQAAIEEAFYELNQRLKTGSLLYVISDFMDLKLSDNKLLAQLQSRYYVQALHVLDQAEQKHQKVGGVCLQDMNSEAHLSINSDKQDVNDNLQKTLEKHNQNIKDALIKSAIDYSVIVAQEDNLYSHINLPLEYLLRRIK